MEYGCQPVLRLVSRRSLSDGPPPVIRPAAASVAAVAITMLPREILAIARSRLAPSAEMSSRVDFKAYDSGAIRWKVYFSMFVGVATNGRISLIDGCAFDKETSDDPTFPSAFVKVW